MRTKSNKTNKKRFQAALANETLGLQRDREELKRLEASFVNRAEVNADIKRLHSEIIANWRTWPKRVAGELAKRINADPAKVELLLQKHINEHLEQFAKDCPLL